MIFKFGDHLSKKLDDVMPNEEKMVEIMQEMQKMGPGGMGAAGPMGGLWIIFSYKSKNVPKIVILDLWL